MVTRGSPTTQHNVGDGRSSTSNKTLYSGETGKQHHLASQVGQHNSGLVHKQARGQKVSLERPCMESLGVVFGAAHRTLVRPYSGEGEQRVRQVVSAGITQDGMEAKSSGILSNRPTVGTTSGGLVCSSGEQPASKILFTLCRPSGSRDGCNHILLESTERLCISPVQSDRTDSVQDKKGTDDYYSGSAILDECSVVSRLDDNDGADASTVGGDERGDSSSQGDNDGDQPSELESGRVTCIRRLLRKENYSDESIDKITSSWKNSKGMDAAWKLWYNWCLDSNQDPLFPSAPVLCDWLNFLHVTDYSSGTISAYWGFVCQVFYLCCKVDLMEEPALKRFVAGVKSARPVKPKYDEAFDITLVIDWIKTNWGNNSALKETFLRSKVILLLRIFNLKRNQDVVRITMDTLVLDGDKPGFRMLGEKRQRQDLAYSSFCPLFTNPVEELCPIAAIKAYNSCSSPDKKYLIAQLKSANSMQASSIRKIVQVVMTKVGIPVKFKSHSIRMAATTKLLEEGMSVDQVMTLGGWSSMSVFHKFYNRRKLDNPTELIRPTASESADEMEIESAKEYSDEF